MSLISGDGGYPSAVVTRAHSLKAAAAKAAPAGAAATAPALERVTTAIVEDAPMPPNFAHICRTMLSLIVLVTPPAARAVWIALQRADRSPLSSPNVVCPVPWPGTTISPSDATVTRCLVPGFDGALFSPAWGDALWAKFFMAAPRRQRQSVERYSVVKRA